MSASGSAYPSSEAIRHGAWLKQFVTHLPELTDRYGLAETYISSLQHLLCRYLAWLLDQATGPQQPATEGLALLAQVHPLVEQLRHHPAFCLADAQRLRLADVPWLTLSALVVASLPAPLPAPRLAVLHCAGPNVVVLWHGHRGTRFELQVSRSARDWQALPAPQRPPHRLQDPLPLAHTRRLLAWHYRGRFVGPNGQPGPWSETLRVILAPGTSGSRPPDAAVGNPRRPFS